MADQTMKVTVTSEYIEIDYQRKKKHFKNKCPHQDKKLYPTGHVCNIHDGYLTCQHHGAVFDIENGECVSGPCQGQFIQPITPE